MNSEEKKFDLVLKYADGIDGLNKDEIMELLEKAEETDLYPIELELASMMGSLMGFISREAASLLEYNYRASGLYDFLSVVAEDLSEKEYTFRGICIYIS